MKYNLEESIIPVWENFKSEAEVIIKEKKEKGH